MTATLRVLLLSGGGWHGAVQVPILRELLKTNLYDLVLGVSVGSVNGVTLACGAFESVTVPLWDGLDDHHPIDGIKGFLAPAFLGGKGLFKLAPMQKLLDQHIPKDGSKLRCAFGAGYVVRETGLYGTAVFLPPTGFDPEKGAAIRAAFGAPKLGLHDAVIASAAVAGVMEPVAASIGTCCDGGHVHVLPCVPDDLLPRVTSIDAVFCKPTSHTVTRPTSDVNGLVEAIGWATDMQMEAPRIADFAWLRAAKIQHPSMNVRVFAPASVHGGMLDAKRTDIYDRYKLGEAAWAHPVTL